MITCNILGVNIAVTNINDIVKYIENNLKELEGKYICVSNVHTTVTAYEDEEYRNIQNCAAIVLPDGGPLSSISRKRGFIDAERVTGPDLMGEIFRISEEKGYTHYFYGSTDETFSEATQKLIDGIKEAKTDKECIDLLNPYIKLWQQQGMLIGMKQINDATMLVVEDIIKEINAKK